MADLLVARFSHVWICDDNIRFPQPAALITLLREVQHTNALIAQPAIGRSIHGLMNPASRRTRHEGRCAPLPSCSVRYTDFVEVMSPIFQPCALLELYRRLYWIGRASDWGIDTIWCRYLAKHWKRPLLGTCAVVDVAEGRFSKRYIKHKHSYSVSKAMGDVGCMYKRLRMHWSDCSTLQVAECSHARRPGHAGAASSPLLDEGGISLLLQPRHAGWPAVRPKVQAATLRTRACPRLRRSCCRPRPAHAAPHGRQRERARAAI